MLAKIKNTSKSLMIDYLNSIYLAGIVSLIIFSIGLFGGLLLGIEHIKPELLHITVGSLILLFSAVLFIESYSVLSHRNGILVTNGIYSYMRHPRFLGFILIFIGSSLALGSITALVLSIFSTIIWHTVALKKEKDLVNKFGSDYLKYMKSVPRYIPKKL